MYFSMVIGLFLCAYIGNRYPSLLRISASNYWLPEIKNPLVHSSNACLYPPRGVLGRTSPQVFFTSVPWCSSSSIPLSHARTGLICLTWHTLSRCIARVADSPHPCGSSRDFFNLATLCLPESRGFRLNRSDKSPLLGININVPPLRHDPLPFLFRGLPISCRTLKSFSSKTLVHVLFGTVTHPNCFIHETASMAFVENGHYFFASCKSGQLNIPRQ